GSGMSALAQFQAMRGGVASGSDRAFDRGERAGERAKLERLGITIVPQDGAGVAGATALVLSTAVEPQVPDVAAALACATPFGLGPGEGVRALHVALEGSGSAFSVDGVRFALGAPGRHNVENAVAAIAACRAVGVPPQAMVDPLARFAGVGRRFQSLGTVN